MRSCFVLAFALCVADVCAAGASSVWTGALPAAFKSGAAVPPLETTGPASEAVAGDFARFERVWAKAERGGPLRLAVIGGSITQGAGASSRDRQWGSLFRDGWRRAFPRCEIAFVNAGIGATGSQIGAFRLKRDVLDKEPDVVAVEFSVNDAGTRESAEAYEGVLRQLLGDPRGIAVVALGMVGQNGGSAQAWHAKVAAHYGVPYVSYKDALYPYVAAGKIRWSDISPDTIHPNDDGHAYAAALVNRALARRYDVFKAAGRAPAEVPPVPAPLFGRRYDGGEFRTLDNVDVRVNEGFFPLRDTCWGNGLACTNADKRLVFEVPGSTVAILYRLGNQPYNWGKVEIKIDGRVVEPRLDCFRDQWWWYTPALFLCKDSPGTHTVEVRTLAEKNEKSAGYGCHITGVLTSDHAN